MTPALLLALAIAAEVAATLSLRAADGFTKLGPSILVVAGYATSTVLLAMIVRWLPISLTYAIWAAAGTATVAIVGMTLLDEPVSHLKIASIVLIVVGIVGLNLAGDGH
jgi:small multidrug resistance pump